MVERQICSLKSQQPVPLLSGTPEISGCDPTQRVLCPSPLSNQMAGLEWLWGRPSCCTFCCLDTSCSGLVLMETLRSKHRLSPKAPRKLPELGRTVPMEVYPCGAPKPLLLPRGSRIRVFNGESRLLPGAGGGKTVEEC